MFPIPGPPPAELLSRIVLKYVVLSRLDGWLIQCLDLIINRMHRFDGESAIVTHKCHSFAVCVYFRHLYTYFGTQTQPKPVQYSAVQYSTCFSLTDNLSSCFFNFDEWEVPTSGGYASVVVADQRSSSSRLLLMTIRPYFDFVLSTRYTSASAIDDDAQSGDVG